MSIRIDEKRAEAIKLRQDLYTLRDALNAADENGLFDGKNSNASEPETSNTSEPETSNTSKPETSNTSKPKILPVYTEILAKIYDGFKILDNENLDVDYARKLHDEAYHEFHKVINASERRWRFTYLYGGWLFIYLLGFLGIVLGVWFFYSSVLMNSSVLWVPSWAYLWGLMGGILQSVWILWHRVEFQRLRKHTMAWYVILPYFGAILGAISYLIFYAGFIVATGANVIETEKTFVMLLAVLAGFSSKWAVMLLIKVSELIQPRTQ